MPKGTVKFYIDSKGFGFIKPENGDPEIFFHATAVSIPLKRDQQVQYEIENGKRGLNATKIKKV